MTSPYLLINGVCFNPSTDACGFVLTALETGIDRTGGGGKLPKKLTRKKDLDFELWLDTSLLPTEYGIP